MSKIESGPWKGWIWNEAYPGWVRTYLGAKGEWNHVWVTTEGLLKINGVDIEQYDTPDQARQAAEGLVRGPVRWADEVDG